MIWLILPGMRSFFSLCVCISHWLFVFHRCDSAFFAQFLMQYFRFFSFLRWAVMALHRTSTHKLPKSSVQMYERGEICCRLHVKTICCYRRLKMAFELWKTSKHVCVGASFSLWRCHGMDSNWIQIVRREIELMRANTSASVCLCVCNVLSLRWISFASKWLFRTQNTQHLIHIHAKWKTMDTLALWSRSGLSFLPPFVLHTISRVPLFFDSVWAAQWIQPFFQPFKGKFHAKIMALFPPKYVCTSSFSYRKKRKLLQSGFSLSNVRYTHTHAQVDRACVFVWRVVSSHARNEQTETRYQ